MDDYLEADGRFRSADEITRMWADWGIVPAGRVSSYCGTGWRASAAFWLARTAGWSDVAVHDSGWMDWTQAPGHDERPIETGLPDYSPPPPAADR